MGEVVREVEGDRKQGTRIYGIICGIRLLDRFYHIEDSLSSIDNKHIYGIIDFHRIVELSETVPHKCPSSLTTDTENKSSNQDMTLNSVSLIQWLPTFFLRDPYFYHCKLL